MPPHDPVPPGLQRAALAWARYKRLTRRMALLATAAAALTLLYFGRGDGPASVAMMIATLAGLGLAALVGTGLMGLVLLGRISKHENAATQKGGKE